MSILEWISLLTVLLIWSKGDIASGSIDPTVGSKIQEFLPVIERVEAELDILGNIFYEKIIKPKYPKKTSKAALEAQMGFVMPLLQYIKKKGTAFSQFAGDQTTRDTFTGVSTIANETLGELLRLRNSKTKKKEIAVVTEILKSAIELFTWYTTHNETGTVKPEEDQGKLSKEQVLEQIEAMAYVLGEDLKRISKFTKNRWNKKMTTWKRTVGPMLTYIKSKSYRIIQVKDLANDTRQGFKYLRDIAVQTENILPKLSSKNKRTALKKLDTIVTTLANRYKVTTPQVETTNVSV
ncbi:unnamed protein product, partial [Owenia fusiformis]